jgi:hypothetical protein
MPNRRILRTIGCEICTNSVRQDRFTETETNAMYRCPSNPKPCQYWRLRKRLGIEQAAQRIGISADRYGAVVVLGTEQLHRRGDSESSRCYRHRREPTPRLGSAPSGRYAKSACAIKGRVTADEFETIHSLSARAVRACVRFRTRVPLAALPGVLKDDAQRQCLLCWSLMLAERCRPWNMA